MPSKVGEVFGWPFQLSAEQTNDNYQITEVERLMGIQLKRDARLAEATLFEKGIEQNRVGSKHFFNCFLQPSGTCDLKFTALVGVCAGPCWTGEGVKTTFCSFVSPR